MRNANALILRIFLALRLSLSLSLADAQEQPPPPERGEAHAGLGKASGLTVLEQPGMTRVEKSHGRFECGQIDILEIPHLERTFRLKNEGKEPVTVLFIRTSCGCEKVAMRKEGQELAQPTLAPGEQMEVQIVVNISKQREGTKRVFAWAQSKDADLPLAEMEIVANILPIVKYEPQVISFGRIEAGQTPSQTLKVIMDKRLAEKVGSAKLQSFSPVVDVAPDTRAEEKTILNGKPALVRYFKVTIKPNAPIRPLMAGLSFRPETPANPTTPPTGGVRDLTRPENAYLLMPLITVTGEVTGPISVLPGNVFFGIVQEGMEQKRTVRITGKTAKLLQGLQVTSSNPAITFKLADIETEKQAAGTPDPSATRILEVTLSPEAKPGPVNARLTLKASTGEELIMSVIAQVQKKM